MTNNVDSRGIKRVGVAGAGLMGNGIAQVSAMAGYETVVLEAREPFLQRGMAAVEKRLDRAVDKGKLDSADRDGALGRLSGTLSAADLGGCDIVIEAITENLDAKKTLYADIEKSLLPDAILASNTSSLSITELAASTSRPERFVGLHFFNPVPVMALVEVVRSGATSDSAADAAFSFAVSLGKKPVSCRDNTGFIVNRLLVPYMLDAIRAYEEGIGSITDIDLALKLGCGYPMGPFTLGDFVGLDTLYHVTEIMFDEYREKRYASPPLLRRLFLAGRHGRKTGIGFYDYRGEKPVVSDFVKR